MPDTQSMFTRRLLGDLYRHMDWADDILWSAIETLGVPRASDTDIFRIVQRLHGTQHGYLNVLKDQPIGRPDLLEFADLTDLRQWSYTFYDDATQFLHEINESSLEAALVVPWKGHFERMSGDEEAQTTTLAEVMFDLVHLCTHLRGVATAEIQTNARSDYMMWVWLGRPDAWWRQRQTSQHSNQDEL